MLSRVLVILVGVPLLYVFFQAGDPVRLLLFATISIRGQYELYQMLPKPGIPKHPVLEYALGTGILGLGIQLGLEGIVLGLAISLLILMSAGVLRGLETSVYHRFALGVTGLLYLPFCLAFYLLIGQKHGGLCLFGVLAVIWILDIGAFIAGSFLRGPKLAPRISPNKTISGAVGGALACCGAVFILTQYQIIPLSSHQASIFALLVSVFGQIADLFESALKRETGVKDTGNLFGGHGGMLDRLDSVVFLGPISWFFLK
jgi:phosphatidate cytidylyltransferase